MDDPASQPEAVQRKVAFIKMMPHPVPALGPRGTAFSGMCAALPPAAPFLEVSSARRVCFA